MSLLMRFTLIGVLVNLWATSFAQIMPRDSSTNGQPSASANTYQTNVQDLFSNFAPKSPTAAGLSRYGDYPVSLYTGLPTIEIPIYEFKVGTLTVPIKLSYHAAGIKVNDLASWVGLGWSLQTGGQITRTVLGRPDELANGLLNQSVPNPTSYYDSNCPNDNNDVQISYRADNVYDTQRDMFAYQTPRGSNTFLLGPASDIPNGYVFLKPEPVTVAYASGLSSLTVTDETGTRFRFSDIEATSSNSNSAFSYSGFASTWYLSEIVSLNSSERAAYTYSSVLGGLPMSPEPIDTQTVLADLHENSYNASGVTSSVGQQPSNVRTDAAVPIGYRFLEEIQFPGGKISFVRENPTIGRYNLDYIDIFSYDVDQSQYIRIKRIDLQFTTVARSTGGASETFLSKVRLLQNDGSTELGSYSFSYNGTPLPAANWVTKDYWGYYNYNPGQTLIPTQAHTFNTPSGQVNLTIGDAIRTPAEDLMKAWVLQSIQYPTGGSTQFEFETNRYNGGTLAGGLRIRQIRSYTAPNQLATVKTYKYGLNENGDGTFRSQLRQQPSSTLNLKHAPDYSYVAYTYSSSPTYPFVPGEGSPVTYPYVTEYNEDGAGNNAGKTIYQFRDAASDSYQYLGAGKGFLTSRSWDRGQLLQKMVIDASGNLRAKTINNYSVIASGNTSAITGALVVRVVKQTGAKIPLPNSNCYPTNESPADNSSDDVYRLMTYNFNYGTTLLTSSQEYLYADDNSNNYTLKVTETDYDNSFYLARETRLRAEGGIVLGTQLTYPQNYTTIPATTTDDELKGILALQQRNAYLPLEIVNYRIESSSTTRNYKTGKLMTYRPITLNGLTTAVAKRTLLLEAVYNTFSQTPYRSSEQRMNAAGSPNSFLYDSSYVQRVSMNYNANGNLTDYTLTNGSTTSFGYSDYTPSGGVLFSVVNQQTLNYGQSNAQTTNYFYKQPLLGPDHVSDVRGVTTSYVYDGFGRLSTVKDKDGSVLKQYQYHYATQP